MLLLLGLLVCLVSGQVSSCSSVRTCAECLLFTDSVNPGSACQWCTFGSSNVLSVGCFAYGTCPGSSSFVGDGNCPVTTDSCPLLRNCNDCVANNGCQWCHIRFSTIESPTNYGCVSNSYTCPGWSFPVNSCSSSGATGTTIAIVLSSISITVGLLIGAFGFYVGYSADAKKQHMISLVLFFLSFVFWGASLFSILLNWKAVNKTSRKCCNGYCFCVMFFGICEMTCVLAGFVTGLSLDLVSLPYTISFGGFGGVYSLAIGLPTAAAGILSLGIPRVAVASCAVKRKVKDDSERAPLVQGDLVVNDQFVNTPSYFPSYHTAQHVSFVPPPQHSAVEYK
jgi:hypothetical protein